MYFVQKFNKFIKTEKIKVNVGNGKVKFHKSVQILQKQNLPNIYEKLVPFYIKEI